MPTVIPQKHKRPIVFIAFICVLFIAAFVLEVIDPAPVDVNAETMSAP